MSETEKPETIEYKTTQPWFDALWTGDKQFEIRVDDRPYRPQVGDRVSLIEFPYTGRWIAATVSIVITHRDFPDLLTPDAYAFGLKDIARFNQLNLTLEPQEINA